MIVRRSALLLLAAALPACHGPGAVPPASETIWTIQDPQNVPVTLSPSNEDWHEMVSDGAGGAIIAWRDWRNGMSNTDIFAQRVDATGAILWTIDGLGILTGPTSEEGFRMLADGAGGIFFIWQEFKGATGVDLFAQRLNESGAPLWGAGGKPVATTSGDQEWGNLVPDGAGGVIIAWGDTRGADRDLYAQRLNGSGDPLWTPDGVVVASASGSQGTPALEIDGGGGVVAVWTDNRNGVDMDIYGQRVNAFGVPQWTPGGAALSTAIGDQRASSIASDGAGGVIVVWTDNRNGTFTDIFAGRLNGAGAAPWTPDGVAISTAPGYQMTPRIVIDGAGGAILVWKDENGGVGNIYGQRLDAAGMPQWTATVHPICTAAQEQANPVIISDGSGGAVITWQDFRNGTYDIYAQRINAAGAPIWNVDGIGICTVTMTNQHTPRMAGNGFGGAIIAWEDARPTGSGSNLYAQGVSSGGLP